MLFKPMDHEARLDHFGTSQNEGTISFSRRLDARLLEAGNRDNRDPGGTMVDGVCRNRSAPSCTMVLSLAARIKELVKGLQMTGVSLVIVVDQWRIGRLPKDGTKY